MFGYTQEDIPTIRHWWPLAYPDDQYQQQVQEEWTRKVHQAIDTQSPIEPMEVVVTCKDGSKKNISWGFITIGKKNYAYGLDLTERKRAEESLYEANKKLRLLTSITRHDIVNQLMIMQSYLVLATDESDISLIQEYISKAHQMGARIETVLGFTREYETFGIISSGWQKIHQILEDAHNDVSLGEVTIENAIPIDIEIYADPIIRKVLTTLIENAVRHGKKITRIRFFCSQEENVVRIICEDDGIGIPLAEKEFIFDHGYGKHTGIGLFLSREILSITGLSIRECGESGEGARFEILVPAGKYRRT